MEEICNELEALPRHRICRFYLRLAYPQITRLQASLPPLIYPKRLNLGNSPSTSQVAYRSDHDETG